MDKCYIMIGILIIIVIVVWYIFNRSKHPYLEHMESVGDPNMTLEKATNISSNIETTIANITTDMTTVSNQIDSLENSGSNNMNDIKNKLDVMITNYNKYIDENNKIISTMPPVTNPQSPSIYNMIVAHLNSLIIEFQKTINNFNIIHIITTRIF